MSKPVSPFKDEVRPAAYVSARTTAYVHVGYMYVDTSPLDQDALTGRTACGSSLTTGSTGLRTGNDDLLPRPLTSKLLTMWARGDRRAMYLM